MRSQRLPGRWMVGDSSRPVLAPAPVARRRLLAHPLVTGLLAPAVLNSLNDRAVIRQQEQHAWSTSVHPLTRTRAQGLESGRPGWARSCAGLDCPGLLAPGQGQGPVARAVPLLMAESERVIPSLGPVMRALVMVMVLALMPPPCSQAAHAALPAVRLPGCQEAPPLWVTTCLEAADRARRFDRVQHEGSSRPARRYAHGALALLVRHGRAPSGVREARTVPKAGWVFALPERVPAGSRD